MAQVVLERLKRKFGEAITHTSVGLGNETAVIRTSDLPKVAQFLVDDVELAFDLPIDCTAIDWFGKREPRFDVVYHMMSTSKGHRVRLKVPIGDGPGCEVPSLSGVWPAMNWLEREVWDMYGIRFSAHPNLKRILLYEEFVGFPLRKDYPICREQPLIEMRDPATGHIP